MEPEKNTYKVVVLGDGEVGKTSVSLRFVTNQFSDKYEQTFGAAYMSQSVVVGTTRVKLEIWDTAGQERYNAVTSLYYRTARAAIVVYDVTNWNSFLRAAHWIEQIKNELPDLKEITLVGNKIDLSSRRTVATEEGDVLARNFQLRFLETSAKTSTNVSELFIAIAQRLVTGKDAPRTPGLTLTDQDRSSVEKSRCC